jgi:asparagine synthase (glutamine-hydrolysing)
MCGIFAMFGAPVETGLAAEVSQLMRHRGPDDSGAAIVGGGLLVNRRLAIVDLSNAAHQPMASADASVWLTFNGEIYNYVELRRELEGSYAFRTRSDTEVIIAAYERWGDRFLPKLRGMFALALWDDRRQRLICATDRLSIKPVLYHFDGERLIVSSEVKPIAAAGVALRPNQRLIYEYLRFGLLDHTEETLFEGIRQLRPGTSFIFESGRLTIHRYWDLAESASDAWHDDHSMDEIEAALQDAVDIHLRGDVEPALSLSSGLDSNVLRALVQRGGHAPNLHCFTACFTGTPYDECCRAAPLVRNASVTHHPTEIQSEGLFENLDALVHVMEQPVGGLGIYAYWLNCRSASDAGFKVLLDGQGADEGFAGYRYYYTTWLAALDAAGAPALSTELAAFNRVHGTAIRHPHVEFGLNVDTAVQAPDGTAMTSDYLAPEFARAYGHPPPELPSPFRDPVKTAMYRDLMFLKIPKLLRFQDRAAMAWSVEVRVPYLDHVLLERLYSVPNEVLLSDGRTKALLRRIARSRLDTAIDDAKLYVATPQREWLKRDCRRDVLALLAESTLASDGYIDPAALAAQYDAYCDSPELGNSFFAWKFVTLELWHRAFVKNGQSGQQRLAALQRETSHA